MYKVAEKIISVIPKAVYNMHHVKFFKKIAAWYQINDKTKIKVGVLLPITVHVLLSIQRANIFTYRANHIVI